MKLLLTYLIEISSLLAKPPIHINPEEMIIIVVLSGGLGIFYVLYLLFTKDFEIGNVRTNLSTIITWILVVLFIMFGIYAVINTFFK